jgi:hypothetical protein
VEVADVCCTLCAVNLVSALVKVYVHSVAILLTSLELLIDVATKYSWTHTCTMQKVHEDEGNIL